MAEETSEIEASGTISPAEAFDKDADAKALFEATQGLGTKEKVITGILTKRTNSQRQDIIEAFVSAYDKELLDVMKSELSGNFLSVVEGLLDEPAVHLAKAVHEYATDTSMLQTTDLGLRLLEIIFPLNYLAMSNYHFLGDLTVYAIFPQLRFGVIQIASEVIVCPITFTNVFGSILDEDINLNVIGPWKLILINVEMGQRHETACIDSYKVDQDVQYLEETPIDDWALPNARIEDLLIRDSVQHLQKVFKRVKLSMSEKGVDIIQAIKDSNMTTEQKDGFVAVVSICTDYVRFNATILHKAMSGVGTDDDTLIRVIVSRCEIDLENIKSEFQQMYGVSLRDWVSSDTSGNYRDILLAIIGA